MSRKLFFRIILAVVVIGAIYRFVTSQVEYSMTHVTGQTMGTIQYNVKYMGEDAPNYKEEIDSVLQALNQALSTYIPDSEISTLNKTGVVENPSSIFLEELEKGREIFDKTAGAFDPTVGPLVNTWGFGVDKRPMIPDSSKVDSLLQLVGFDRVDFSVDRIVMDTSMYLDFSAIAKGHAVDLVAEFLEKKGHTNYMVEIGGEVRAMGENENNEIWSIGIENPLVNIDERELLAIVRLKNRSMATSGNYRNYYTIGERTIAHTIDPRSGYNTNHNLLSASVFADDCMTADAYATAFMVLGLEASRAILEANEIDAFLIYQEEDGSLKSYISKKLKKFISLNKTGETDD